MSNFPCAAFYHGLCLLWPRASLPLSSQLSFRSWLFLIWGAQFNFKFNKYPMSPCISHHRCIGSDLLLVNLTHAGRSFCLQWLGEEVFRRWHHYYSQPAQPLSKAHPSQFEVPKMFPASFIKGKNGRLLWLVLMMKNKIRVERGDTGKKGTKAKLEGLEGKAWRRECKKLLQLKLRLCWWWGWLKLWFILHPVVL